MNLVDDVPYSKFLSANCRGTYERHIGDEKMMIKRKGLPFFLTNVGKETPSADNMGMMHLVDRIVHIFTEKDNVLIFPDVETSV